MTWWRWFLNGQAVCVLVIYAILSKQIRLSLGWRVLRRTKGLTVGQKNWLFVELTDERVGEVTGNDTLEVGGVCFSLIKFSCWKLCSKHTLSLLLNSSYFPLSRVTSCSWEVKAMVDMECLCNLRDRSWCTTGVQFLICANVLEDGRSFSGQSRSQSLSDMSESILRLSLRGWALEMSSVSVFTSFFRLS